MANETAVQTSCIQENHEVDECLENIPPGVTTTTAAAAGTSKLKVQVGDEAGCSSTQPSGENEPYTCTFSTPAPASSGVKAKSRLSGLQSALTPILKYLNIGNKGPSPEPLKQGNNPHATVPFFPIGNTTANCQNSTRGSFQHSNSGRSLGDTTAPVCLLDDEYLPEITLFDVTCDSTMQLTKNDSVLPDSVPATPVTAGSVNSTFTPLQSSRFSGSTNLHTTAQTTCPQNKKLEPLQSNVNSPKAESEAADQASSVSKNTETSLGSCDVQDITFDRHSLQKSSDNTILGEADAATFCLQNNSFDTKPPLKQNGTITVSETSSSDRHQNTLDKPPAPSAKEKNSQVHPPELSKHIGTTASRDSDTKMVDIPEGIDAPMRWLDDRFFPEITLLDVTRDSELSPGGEISRMELTQDISQVDSLQNNMPSSELRGQIVSEPCTSDMIQSEELSRTVDGNVTHTISSFSEQTDKCAGENVTKASLEVTRDISMGSVLEDSRPSLEPSGQNMVKIQTSAEDTLGTHPANVTHDINSSGDMSVQCAASQISTSDVQCNTSSKTIASELHGEPVVTSNAVEANKEELLAGHDAELTSKVPQPSPKTAGSVNSTFTINEHSRLSASNNLNTATQTPCPQNKTLDLPTSNVNSPKVESDATDQASSVSKNATETSPAIHQNRSAVKESGSCDVQNATFDRHSLHKSSGSTILGEAGAATFCLQNNTFDTKSPSKQNGTITLSETSSSDSHQNTLDKLSAPVVFNATSSPKHSDSEVHPPELSKSIGTTASTYPDAKMADTPESTFEANPAVEVASGAGAATFCLQNNTFDTKSPSKQNGTITLSETSSRDSHQNTSDKLSAPVVFNATSSPKDKDSEVPPPELSKDNGTTASTNPDAKMADTPESTFEANPAVEVASGAGRRETKDHSQSGLPMTDGLSDTLGNQSVDTENNRANTLNLDDTLDLRADSLITSTPMTNCKMFNFHAEREEGKILAAQKKLYGDGPSKPEGQAPSEVPSNIVCDRKTFLTQPAAKSLLPPLKAASQLLKYKPASTLPGPLTSGLPMTRQRTQAEALRNTAASDAPQVTTGISGSYNLRATATGSKQPTSGLRKPQLSGIPSGIQRAAAGLRPPSARSNAPASSSTDQLRGPTATNPATKISQAKKHPLTRGEALPIAKKKKIDAPIPSGSAEASTAVCDANKAKNLKRPSTSQRTLPTKIQRDDAAVPASSAGASTSCDAVSRARALKCPAASHRALPAKPQSQVGCAKCVALEQQLELKSEEIRRLKEELLKYSKPEEEC